MRNLDLNLTEQLSKEKLTDFYLLELLFTTPQYFTTLDRPIYYNGNTYVPIAFEAGDIKMAAALSVDKITVEVDNVGLRMSSILLAADQRGKVCNLYYGVLIRSTD